jgi:hypothetical protein
MLNVVKHLYRIVERYAAVSVAAFLVLLPLSGYKSDNLKDEKYLNFLASLENESTSGYFTVITAKDLKTGLTKEVCTKGNFVSGALHIELNADYDVKGSHKVLSAAKANKAIYFEFKKRKALDNISYFDYDDKYVATIAKRYKIDSAVAIIKKNNKYSINIPANNRKYFAHALFNRGYLSGDNDCFGGPLVYIDRNKINRKQQ